MTTKVDRLAVLLMVLCIVMIVSAFAAWSLVFAWAAVVFVITYAWMGALKQGSAGPLRVPLLTIGGTLLIALAAIFVLWRPGQQVTGTVLGFAPATAIVVYVIWLVPALLGVAYVRHFDRFVITDDDLRRVREVARRS